VASRQDALPKQTETVGSGALTVTDLLQHGELGLSVITGAARLRGAVHRAYVTDLPDPGRYLRPGDLVLTSGIWYSEPADCDRFVDAVALSRAAGLVVGLLVLKTMPQRMIDACSQHGLPLLTIAPESSFGPVTEMVMSHTLASQDATLTHTAAFHKHLVEAVSRSQGIAGILALFGREYFLDCWAISAAGTVLASVGGHPSASEADAAWNRSLSLPAARHIVDYVDGQPITISVIGWASTATAEPTASSHSSSHRGIARGVLGCRGDYRDWSPDALEAWQTVIDLHGVELEMAHSKLLSEHRRIAELVDALGAESAAPGEVSALLRLLGADPRLPTVIISAALSGEIDPVVLDQFLQASLAGGEGFVASCVIADEVIVIVNGPHSKPDVIAQLLTTATQKSPTLLERCRVAIGVSEATTSVSQLSAALAGSRERLQTALSGNGSLTVIASSDADSHTMLISALPVRLRRNYRDRMLAPILEYDQLRGSDLLKTLVSFLETCGSWQRSAEELHVHVNTLRYRVQRIEELTGKDLSVMRDRTDLYLALECVDTSEIPDAAVRKASMSS
jgi:hypothetical protein